MPWSLGDIAALVAIIALLGGVVVGWTLVWNRRIRRRLDPVARGLGLAYPAAGGNESPHVLRGEWSGVPVRIQYQVGGRGERDRLHIALEAPYPVPAPVRFRRETLLHRFAKAIGLTHEPQAADPLFDREVFVDSERDDAIPAVIADYRVRESILRLLSRHARSLVSLESRSATYTVRSHVGWAELFHPAAIRAVLGELRTLAGLLGRGEAGPEATSGPPLRDTPVRPAQEATVAARGSTKAVPMPPLAPGSTLRERLGALARAPSALILIFGCLLMFVGPVVLMAGLRYPTLGWRLELVGLAASVLLLTAYTGVAYSRLRGRTRSHSDLSVFLFAGAVGIPTFLVGSLLLANGLLGRGEPLRVAAEIVAVSPRSVGAGDVRVQVRVHLDGGARKASLEVPPALLGRPAPGQQLVLIVAPGALGEPRLLEVEGVSSM